MDNSWLYCPLCSQKTRIQIRKETIIKCFPLYCPKCKRETLIDVKEKQIILVTEPDA